MVRSSVATTVIIAVCYLSCGTAKQYSVDKLSPKGTYRVKIQVTPGKRAGLLERAEEHCKIQYFKGQQVIGGYETNCRQDEYEIPLYEGWQVVEWVRENVVRIGRDRSQQPFRDELLISNKTGESINYLDIGYGRFESFRIFDLPAGDTLTLSASPEFKPDGTSNHSLSYIGITQGGKSLEGALKDKQRNSPSEGPLRLQITIDSKSYRE